MNRKGKNIEKLLNTKKDNRKELEKITGNNFMKMMFDNILCSVRININPVLNYHKFFAWVRKQFKCFSKLLN